MQSALVKLEDVDAAYRRLLSIDKEFAEEVGKKYADDLREAFRKGREQEKEDYKWEIDFYHEIEQSCHYRSCGYNSCQLRPLKERIRVVRTLSGPYGQSGRNGICSGCYAIYALVAYCG